MIPPSTPPGDAPRGGASGSRPVNPACVVGTAARRPACPVCGGPLIEIRAKLQCANCRTICETCCEGGRG